MKRVRVVIALGLLAACVGLSSDAQARQAKATIKFVGGTPLPGAKAGEITITVQWANCPANIGSVVANGWTANKGKLVFAEIVSGTAQNPLKQNGSYSWNVTGLKSGDVISIIESAVFDNTGTPGNLIVTTNPLDKNSQPVPFNGCTVP
jgi:hypothetical protein